MGGYFDEGFADKQQKESHNTESSKDLARMLDEIQSLEGFLFQSLLFY